MIKIGLVGLGYIGKMHLQAYEKVKNCEVTVICTRNELPEDLKPASFKGRLTTNYDDLLNDPTIDMIDICLPTFLHEEYILKAVRAGKHVICEKPLTLTEESALRIIEEVKNHQVKLFVGHVLRFWPEYQAIKNISSTNQFDHIEVAHAKRLGQIPTWSTWFQDPKKSGGALFDLHIHDIDFLTYLLGEVESVYAVGCKNQYGAWDHVMTTLTFKNECQAFVEASHRMPSGFPFTMSLRLQGEKDTLDFMLTAGENINSIDKNNQHLKLYTEGRTTDINFQSGDAFENELAYFVNCVDKNEVNTVIPLDDVLYSLKIIQAIEKSLEVNEVIKL